MNRRIVLLPCVIILAATQAFAADVQVLGLQLPGEQADMLLASKENNDQCGDYRIDAITLSVVPSDVVTDAGTVAVLDPTKQQIALKKVALKEQTNVKVAVLNKDNAAAESLRVVLMKLKDGSDETEVVSRADTNDLGEATFSDTVPAGSYQVALECGAPIAAVAAPLGAAGAIGATALAIGLSGGGSGSSGNVGRTVTAPAAADPVSVPSLAPQHSNTSVAGSHAGSHGSSHGPGINLNPVTNAPSPAPQGSASL